jgi:hypothetical protein
MIYWSFSQPTHLQLLMPEFTNLNDAFQWWIENIYPDLKPEEKENLRYFKYNFLKNRPISEDKMRAMMTKDCNLKEIVIIEKK